MPPLEEYLKEADILAQKVVDAWGLNVQAGNANLFTDEFNFVLEKAHRYRAARSIADNRRKFDALTEQGEAEENATRLAFAEAYKSFHEKHAIAPTNLKVTPMTKP
jgi:hypothetical protein